MNIECEASFYDINKDEIRQKLLELNANRVVFERIMRRVNYFIPEVKNGWMRVRDEGAKITMSIKQWHGETIDDQKEVCLQVDSFEEALNFLDVLGFKRKSYQETLREEWDYHGVQITIDTWPGLKPFVEIEAENETIVKDVTKKLGLDYNDAIFGPVGVLYDRYLGISEKEINDEVSEITFENPPKSKK